MVQLVKKRRKSSADALTLLVGGTAATAAPAAVGPPGSDVADGEHGHPLKKHKGSGGVEVERQTAAVSGIMSSQASE